jgi:hypothetical protein
VDHCTRGVFTIDPHKDLSSYTPPSFPDGECSITGNIVSCSDPHGTMNMWPSFGGSLSYNLPITITGKIKDSTPAGTIIKSTSEVGTCFIEYYGIDQGGLAEGYSISESQVLVTGNPSPIPEFPSTVIPATMIIGFLGALLLIQRNEYAL